MIAEGTWKARGVDAALGYTSGDNEQVAVDLVLLEGDDAGQHITWYGYFTEKTVERTVESLRLLGWATDDLADLTGIEANEVYIVIAHEEDQEGKPHARVRWINGSGGLALKKRMDAGDAKAFAERMKGHVLSHKQRMTGAQSSAGPTPAKPAARPATKGAANNAQRSQPRDFTPAPQDDEIPF